MGGVRASSRFGAVVAVLLAFAAPFAFAGALQRDEVTRAAAQQPYMVGGAAEPFTPETRTVRVHRIGAAVPVPRMRPLRRLARPRARRGSASAAPGRVAPAPPVAASVRAPAPPADSARPAAPVSVVPAPAPVSAPLVAPAPAPAPKTSRPKSGGGGTFDSGESFDTTG